MFLMDRGVLGKTATTKKVGFFILFIYIYIFKFTDHFFILLEYVLVYMAGHHTFVCHNHIPT
jgi:hypothetical protein